MIISGKRWRDETMLFTTKHEPPEDTLKSALSHCDDLPAKTESPDHESNVLSISLKQHAAMPEKRPAVVVHTHHECSELQRFQQLLDTCFAGFRI